MYGKPASETSSSVSAASTSRERGPASVSTPARSVTFSSVTPPSSGRCRSIHARSCTSVAAALTTYQRSGPRRVSVRSHSMPPCSSSICVTTMRPSLVGSAFAHRRSRNEVAPGPRTTYFPKLVWSRTPTRSRTARHSAATCSSQFGVRNVRSSAGSTPGGANQSGRSHPNRKPITAPRSRRRSYRGSVFSGRPVGRSWCG